MKNLFIITSSICSNLKSVYTPEERYQQTLKTIDSIRNIKNSYIFLVENTNINKYETEIKNRVDLFLKVQHNLSKSGGELMLVKSALEYVNKNSLSYDIIYKISGRYLVSEKFKLITNNKISFKRINNCVSTVMYSFGFDKVDEMISIFSDVQYYLNFGLDIEHSMFECIKNKNINWVDCFGVVGNVAPTGQFIEY